MGVTTRPLPLLWIIFRALWHAPLTRIPTGLLSCHSVEQARPSARSFKLFYKWDCFDPFWHLHQKGFGHGGLLLNGEYWSGQSGRAAGGIIEPPVKTVWEVCLDAAVSSALQENMGSLWTEEAPSPSDSGSALLKEMNIIRYVFLVKDNIGNYLNVFSSWDSSNSQSGCRSVLKSGLVRDQIWLDGLIQSSFLWTGNMAAGWNLAASCIVL